MSRSEINSSQSSSNGDVDLNDEIEKDDLKELDLPIKQIESDPRFQRRFFIAKDDLISSSAGVYALRHPRSSTKAYYHIEKNGDVQEIMLWGQNNRSMFYGDSVVSDGSLNIFCSVHPMFLVIRYLVEKAQNRYVTLEDCLADENVFPGIRLLMASTKLEKALKIAAEYKEIDDEVFYKYNEDLLLKWLEKRFDILMNSLSTNGNLNKNVLNNVDVLRRYTFGVLSDYLPEEIEAILKTRLQIKDVECFAEPLKPEKRVIVVKGEEKENGRKRVSFVLVGNKILNLQAKAYQPFLEKFGS